MGTVSISGSGYLCYNIQKMKNISCAVLSIKMFTLQIGVYNILTF